MTYEYGEFTDRQVELAVKNMHGELHRLLLYKDKDIKDKIFESESEYLSFFKGVMLRIGGLNTLLGNPKEMISLMSSLQAAYDISKGSDFDFRIFRKLILDSHGYLSMISKGLKGCDNRADV